MASAQIDVAKKLVSEFLFYLSTQKLNKVSGPYGDYLYIFNFCDVLEIASYGATLFAMAKLFKEEGFSFTYHFSGEDGYEPIGLTDRPYHGDILISLTRD